MFGEGPRNPPQNYDDWAIDFRRRANEKFKGQRLRKVLGKYAWFTAKFIVCWVCTSIYVWIGLTFFAQKLNAIDHLAGFQMLDWLEMGFVASVLLYFLFKLFNFVVEDESR